MQAFNIKYIKYEILNILLVDSNSGFVDEQKIRKFTGSYHD